jgi:hypothetical protein
MKPGKHRPFIPWSSDELGAVESDWLTGIELDETHSEGLAEN